MDRPRARRDGGLLYQPAETTGTVPLFATATGKAWLATLEPNDAVQHIARQGGFSRADRYGPNVIRSIDALLKELRATAKRGYGLAFNEAEPGVTAIAAAIRSGGDKATVGTVSIAGPSARMTERRVRELAPLVTQCAAELSTLWPVRERATRVARIAQARSRTHEWRTGHQTRCCQGGLTARTDDEQAPPRLHCR